MLELKSQPKCRHVHVDKRSKTDGTPYVKGWCEKCKAFVYTEKTFCICCRRRVFHKTHHLRLKRVLNQGLKEHFNAIDDYKFLPHRSITYVEIVFDKRIFHIPLKYLALYAESPFPSEILPLIQDSVRIVEEK